MALTDVTVTFDLADILGTDFDARRTKIRVYTNVANQTLMDTSTGETRIGDARVTLATDGTGSFTTWAPGADGNPISWQTYIAVDYPRTGARDRVTRTFGPYTITANADLTELEEEQAVPAEYLTVVTAALDAIVTEAETTLDGYVTDAETAKTGAEAARDLAEQYRDEAHDISMIDTSDGVVEALIQDSGSDTSAALTDSFDAMMNVVQSKAINDGTTDNTTLLQAELDAIEAAGGGLLQLPGGVTVGAVILASDCGIIGTGVGGTTLKAPASLAVGVVRSKGFATYSGSATLSPETRGAHRVTIANLTIDGNKTNAASSVGIQIYGAGWRFHNVRAQNCGSDGIYTEFGQDVNFSTFNTLEGNADNIVTCGNGRHGWLFRGPHDSNINNLIAHSNTSWGFRNESSVGFYNGTLGHCSKFNLFLNANGWYVGDGVASYTGGQSAGGNTGTGLEFKAGIGSVIITGLLVAGWTTGAILRGSQHDVELLVQRNSTGISIDGMGNSLIRMVGEVSSTGTYGIDVVTEAAPSTILGTWTVASGKTLVNGTWNAANHIGLVQTGGAGNDFKWQVPGVFTLPSSTEVRTARVLASTGNIIAGRNTAGQIQIGPTVAFGGVPGVVLNDATILRDGTSRIGVPATHTIRTGRDTTANRPTASTVGSGAMFFDTTLGKAIDSDGTSWKETSYVLYATATLDFPSIAAGSSQELTITVTGAAVGDTVALGAPAAIEAGLVWNGYVSATNTVKVRVSNITGSAVDPASATWKATVLR